MIHTLSVLVENKPGALMRITSLFARRGFNIESLAVGPTERPEVSRITMRVNCEQHSLEQIEKQMHKLVNVLRVVELDPGDSIQRELLLIKVAVPPERRAELMSLGDVFHARRHASEHDVAAALGTDRVRAGTVDGRPDDLRERFRNRDRRRVQRLPSGDGSDAERETVVANTADEALVELRAPAADMLLPRLLCDLDGDRRGDVAVQRRRSSLRDERLAVEEAHAVRVGDDREWTIEWRRQPERHFDLGGVDERGKPTTRVASVGRRQRPSEVTSERDLHRPQTTD